MGDNVPCKKINFSQPEGSRKKGRPRLSWIDWILKYLNDLGSEIRLRSFQVKKKICKHLCSNYLRKVQDSHLRNTDDFGRQLHFRNKQSRYRPGMAQTVPGN
jgi:hypothetical protein